MSPTPKLSPDTHPDSAGTNGAPGRSQTQAAPKRRRGLRILLFAGIPLCILAICGGLYAYKYAASHVLIGGTEHSLAEESLSLTSAADADPEILSRFTELKTLDLTESDVTPAQAVALQEALPHCSVRYSIQLCGTRYPADSETLTLPDLTEADLAQLSLFPYLTEVDARGSDCYAALSTLSERLPNCTVRYTATVAGKTLENTDEALDLTGTAPDPEALSSVLPFFPALKRIDLHDTGLSAEQIGSLLAAFPDIAFSYAVPLYGVLYESDTEQIDLSGQTLPDLAPLRAAVPLLPSLQAVDMCECGYSDEEMAALNEEFPGVRFVWIVKFGRFAVRSDITYFATWRMRVDDEGYIVSMRSAGKTYSSVLCKLQYCTELVALDLGHNLLTDISFLSKLTKLKYLILAINQITDITPLAGLTELKYLELMRNDRLSDLSPLANLKKLEAFSVFRTNVTDVSVLYDLPALKWVYLESSKFPRAKRAEIAASLPEGCRISYRPQNSYAGDWHTGPYYIEMRKALHVRVDD